MLQPVLVRIWPVPALDDMVAVEKVVMTESIDIADGEPFRIPELPHDLMIERRVDEGLPEGVAFELRINATRREVKYLEEQCGWTRILAPCSNCPSKRH